MKAPELMRGDKVAYNGNIVSINSVENLGGLIIIENENICDLVPDSELSPIPLTEEILEKNGFHEGCYKWCDVNGIMIEVCLMQDIPMYVRAEWNYCFPHPYYVHELQHILRLCELRDLADNLKIEEVKK